MIKKYISMLIFIMIINSITIAQDKKFDVVKPANDIGVELGPSLSQFIYYSKSAKNNVNKNVVFDFKLGYMGGAFFQYNFSSYFSLKSGVEYEKKLITSNMEIFINNENETEQWSTLYNYITIPLLAKYNINLKKNRFFIDAGTYVDILMLSKGKTKLANIINSNYNLTKGYRRLFLGISAGFGAIIPINKKYDMSFEVRDNYGLTRIAKKCDSPNDKSSLNSELFLYSIIYHIKDKKK